MEPFYQQNFTITDNCVDCFGRLKPSMVLFIAQTVASCHGELMQVGYDTLNPRRMFWAVSLSRLSLAALPA